MERYEALEIIDKIWNDPNATLESQIIEISNAFYSVGLDLATTAAYIKATPSELDALLSLGALDEELIKALSDVNPPKTTWSLIAYGSDDEIAQALEALKKTKNNGEKGSRPMSEYVYQQMIAVAEPTIEQKVGVLSGADLYHALKKGEDFSALNDWETKFLKSVAGQKKRGKTLSDKQIANLIKVLNKIIEKGAIERNSIDGDKKICDRILDSLEK